MKPSFKTTMPNAASVERKWYVVDASGKTLGRFASRIASILKGKNKPYYAPHVDCGDHVVIINAEKIRVTGKKTKMKEYIRNTGYPGGQRIETFETLIHNKPEQVLYLAIHGMLPKNRLGYRMIKKLKIYTGEKHPHAVQNPETLNW